jgi:hypothetical protein
MMPDPTVEQMIATFARAQLLQVMTTGHNLGLAPVTTTSAILQVAAGTLAELAPAATVAMLRAYADCIEAGPGDGAAQAAARASFHAAAEAFIATARASVDFPAPQGRA